MPVVVPLACHPAAEVIVKPPVSPISVNNLYWLQLTVIDHRGGLPCRISHHLWGIKHCIGGGGHGPGLIGGGNNIAFPVIGGIRTRPIRVGHPPGPPFRGVVHPGDRPGGIHGFDHPACGIAYHAGAAILRIGGRDYSACVIAFGNHRAVLL